MTLFVAEISSNHNGDLQRCRQIITAAADAGCGAVKFQLFRIEQLFAPEILQVSEAHRLRRRWELPPWFLPELAVCAHDHGLLLGCTPFDLEAVDMLSPHVDFLKIASYELCWPRLITSCAATGRPLMMSTGMANQGEILAAVDSARNAGCTDLTLFHCVSSYPTPPDQCNLGAIGTLRTLISPRFPHLKVGWSDHSVHPEVVRRAATHWRSDAIEFHFDLEGVGREFDAGHCWLPATIAPVIGDPSGANQSRFDGDGRLGPAPCETEERLWRADPQDGLRPNRSIRQVWAADQPDAHPAGPRILMIPAGPGWGHVMRCVALAEALRDVHQADIVFLLSEDPGQANQLNRHGLPFVAMPAAGSTWDPDWLRTLRIRLTALAPTGFDAVVVDTMAELAPILEILTEFGLPTIVIDKPDAPTSTLGIVPSLTWTPPEASTQLVGGPRFLLIRSDVKQLRPQEPPAECNGPVVISFGGTDPNRLTELCLTAVTDALPDVPVQVVVGPGFADRVQRCNDLKKTGLQTQIIPTAQGLEKIMAQAGLLVTALGVTVGEALCLGRPCAVLGFRPQDKPDATQLAQEGLIVSLGLYPNIQAQEVGHTLASVWKNLPRRLDIAQAGWAYCNGQGPILAANHIVAWIGSHKNIGSG